jgi:hypothetical protein
LTAVAPIVRFNALDIFVTPTFLRASDFSSRTSEEVHARLTDFFFFISIPVPVYESRASNTPFSFGNTPDFHGTVTNANNRYSCWWLRASALGELKGIHARELVKSNASDVGWYRQARTLVAGEWVLPTIPRTTMALGIIQAVRFSTVVSSEQSRLILKRASCWARFWISPSLQAEDYSKASRLPHFAGQPWLARFGNGSSVGLIVLPANLVADF